MQHAQPIAAITGARSVSSSVSGDEVALRHETLEVGDKMSYHRESGRIVQCAPFIWHTRLLQTP